MTFRVLRAIAVAVLVVLIASSCRVDTSELSVVRNALTSEAGDVGPGGLPILGPIPGASHWHAAYVVRICDEVLVPFDATDDPLGIHSHADGVMHVHPFYEESGYEAATIGLFADAMGMKISDGEITLPSGGTWRDGDLCNGIPSRLFVDRWRDSDPESPVERIFTDVARVRYLADGELYQIAFAPVDSFPVVPPASATLDEYSDLSDTPEPWVSIDGGATRDQVAFWQVSSVSIEPCSSGQVPEVVLYGSIRCFEQAGSQVSSADGVSSARAVILNRQPAVEVVMLPGLQQLVFDHFANTTDPMVLAIEVNGQVVTAPQIVRPPVSNRLVVSGGLSTDTAQQLADLLDA